MKRTSLVAALLGSLCMGFVSHAKADPQPRVEPIAFAGQWAPQPATWKFPVWSKGCARMSKPEDRAACLDFVTADWPRLARFAEANAALAAPKPGEKRVVFFGDSITDNWSRPAYGGLFVGKPYVNRGIGGQTTGQMLLRFRADVLAARPRAVVILAGTNDLAGNSGVATLGQIEDNLTSMAELAKANHVKVVLASVLPVTDDKKNGDGTALVRSDERPPAEIKRLNEWLVAYAKNNGHVYLDYFTAMADDRGMLKSPLTDDGLHPNAAGYAVMAPLAEQAIAKALGSR